MEGNEANSDDSDVLEVAVVPPRARAAEATTDTMCPGMRPLKRRRSSPQMDPIPSYTPTPLHILEQRARQAANTQYTPSPILPASTSPTSVTHDYSSDTFGASYDPDSCGYNYNDYTPLLEPSPSVVGHTIIHQTDEPSTSRQRKISTSSRQKVPAPSANAIRPVSSALAQAVSRRRNSQQDKNTNPQSISRQSTATQSFKTNESSSINAEEPVIWSPRLPSEIKPSESNGKSKTKGIADAAPTADDQPEKYTSPRIVKQRIAHKPIISSSKTKGQPKIPLGVAKKVPSALRIKYLDVIINEYLSTGHPAEQSYKEALDEEWSIANRAANKSIYINLVAGLKKKIRAKAGVSTLNPNEDPKFVDGNKVVSHSDILNGKAKGTFSIEKKQKTSDPASLNEFELYDRLLRYLVPVEQLEAYGYPSRDPDNPSLRKLPLGKDGQKQKLRSQIDATYTCERCAKVYRVDDMGIPLTTTGKCIYHPGRLWNERINRSLEKRYSCCKGDPSAGGCSSNPYHVHKGDLELINFQNYVETQPKPEKDPNRHGIYALDCEMCYTTYGLELTRVTVINYQSEVVYEKLVRPGNYILDYNTKFSGIKDGDLDNVQTSLTDVQSDLLDMFSSKSILIGHSLDSDMKALKIFHKRFIDTAQLFPHKRGLPFKRALRTLMSENLMEIIQDDVGHDSKEDASAALRLVMWKAKTDVPVKS